ncbi:hypothetical protein HYPSUDRAFT_441237 [Hypholoma sublateritium FD-334 SS-4]|uniref:Uncharacterized protein n=1 Tax=Hypholoma sublateritium (strain FD-334 SS-4) TaxID=945553 RepID=A0A0D2MMP6_HYPSF|nr:hypothetical protein HYPSUDRAFT_441237 [Hypholoma sublateritium FD-334 SS-4]
MLRNTPLAHAHRPTCPHPTARSTPGMLRPPSPPLCSDAAVIPPPPREHHTARIARCASHSASPRSARIVRSPPTRCPPAHTAKPITAPDPCVWHRPPLRYVPHPPPSPRPTPSASWNPQTVHSADISIHGHPAHAFPSLRVSSLASSHRSRAIRICELLSPFNRLRPRGRGLLFSLGAEKWVLLRAIVRTPLHSRHVIISNLLTHGQFNRYAVLPKAGEQRNRLEITADALSAQLEAIEVFECDGNVDVIAFI